MDWMKTNTPYSTSDVTPANASCAVLNRGPGALVVNVGSTRLSVTSAVITVSAEYDACTRNSCTRCRNEPTTSDSPRMPLQVIITAAKTVSRANDAVLSPPDAINVTISATSMTVTASARISVPKGSPTRCATTSA